MPKLNKPTLIEYGNAYDAQGERVIGVEALAQMRERGGTWAAYQNMDLGSRNVGHLQFLQVGPERTFKEAPDRYPDTKHGIGWRYLLIGYVRLSDGAIIETPENHDEST